MRSGIIGIKQGMSCVYDDQGVRHPVTLIKINNCQVVSSKNKEKHGYDAVVVGSCDVTKLNKMSKPLQKFYNSIKINAKKKLIEFRVEEDQLLDTGYNFKPSYFGQGQLVDVSGTTIGKGFAGVMKRHNFRGMVASHGVSISHRAHGSTGQCQDPGKVFKNKKMAGQMGSVKMTQQNLRVIKLDDDKNLLVIRGSIPGSSGSYVYIRDAIKT